MANYPVAAFLRTVRRFADPRQREAAHLRGIRRQPFAAMNARTDVSFEQSVEVAGLRLVILDPCGCGCEQATTDRWVRDRRRDHLRLLPDLPEAAASDE